MEGKVCVSVMGGSIEEEQQHEKMLDELPEEIQALARRYEVVFTLPQDRPPDREVRHKIVLKEGATSIKSRPYPPSGEKLEAMRTQVADLVDKGWIRPSHLLWASPILFVPKAGGEWRGCVDFRGLNAVTVDDAFPLPWVDVLLHKADSSCWFSKLDLTSGFHQIALEEESMPLTAFRLPEPVRGSSFWKWTVMPFGLKNAPPTFQRAMALALEGCEDFMAVYVDDVLVFSRTRDAHLGDLESVLARLAELGFRVRLEKCSFMKKQVEFLGLRLSRQGLRIVEEKAEALQRWQLPLATAKQVRQFLGLVHW